MSTKLNSIAWVLSVAAIACCTTALAQPSGGPYGPTQLVYEVPGDVPHIYYVAPEGKANSTGESIDAPTSLEAAIERVVTGDAIILRDGTYRTGNLRLNQGVTLQPYRNERPVLKGTRVAIEWERLRDGLWRTPWKELFPSAPQDWWRREREASRTPLYKFNNDMIFVDGKLLDAVGWAGEVNRGSYWIDYEKGYIYIGVDPEDKLVEITAFDSALVRTTGDVHGKSSDRKGSTIRGITFTQYAYRAIEIEGKDPEGVSPEAEHGKDVVGSTFEHCTFSFCSRVAGYFRGDQLTIRNCLVTDSGTEGIYILSSNDVLLERNIITRTNIENITGYYASAVKIFNQCYRVTCRENLVIDNGNGSSGIWYDVGEVDGVFVNNWIERTDNGFFFEISQGAICAGNVFVDCGTGIKILNAKDVQVYQNTFLNSMAWFERTPRSAVGDHFGWHPATGPDVDERAGHTFVGNLLVADEEFDRPLVIFAQTATLRDELRNPQVSALDSNVYVRRNNPGDTPPSIYGVPTDFQTPPELHSLNKEFESSSQTFSNYFGPLFKGEQLSRYDLLGEFPGSKSTAALPAEVLELLHWDKDAATFPGAFPVVDR
jgi:Right handed beta helix region